MAEASEERARIVAALEAADYVVQHAANALGVAKTTLRRRIAEHGLDEWLEEHSRRIARRRMNREAPPAPHEPSRQAQDQAEHRSRGLCSCGKPPAPKTNGQPGRMCEKCRERERGKKRRAAAAGALSPEMRATLGVQQG